MLPTSFQRVRWASPFDGLHEDLDRMLRRWWSEPDRESIGGYPVDIHEDENHLYVEAELPGFTKEQVQVTLENGVLSISGERKDEPVKGQPHLTERRITRVARSFTLPRTLDEGKVDARLDNGVLHLTLHKREEVKPKRIEVK